MAQKIKLEFQVDATTNMKYGAASLLKSMDCGEHVKMFWIIFVPLYVTKTSECILTNNKTSQYNCMQPLQLATVDKHGEGM